MRWIEKLLGIMAIAFTLGCVASVTAQITGIGLAWSQGMLTQDKIVRYAGVVYGLDPLDLNPPKTNSPRRPVAETREEILAERMLKTPYLEERASTMARDADDVRGITFSLKRNREKYVSARDGFESLLDQLESETETSALRELQITVEVAAPKQAKDILRTMLASAPADPTDDVMRDVIEVIKSLPDNKLRKLLAEFKTDDERVLLHRILVEIGALDERGTQLSGTQP